MGVRLLCLLCLQSTVVAYDPLTVSIAVQQALKISGGEKKPRESISAASLKLGLPLAHGAFGQVVKASAGKRACIAKRAERNKDHANEYLDAEDVMNQKVCMVAPGSRHLAPYLGSYSIGGLKHLVWEACPGAQNNLRWYFHQPNYREEYVFDAVHLLQCLLCATYWALNPLCAGLQ